MKKWAYYNDVDPNCCAWIRELIRDGLITDGEVDCRSIADVRGDDVRGFLRVHFFAGIAGWDYALRLAGWPDDEPVATASCPCQPLSCSGLRLGEKDERHLWPELYRLVSECGFPRIYGEQVASPDGLEWLDGVSLDLEELGYSVAAGDYPAAGVQAPQLRQRIYWVADAAGTGWQGRIQETHELREGFEQRGQTPRLGHAHDPRPQGRSEHRNSGRERTPWAASVGVCGNDGTWRRIEPGIPPLAPGLSYRVAHIRGSGNSIVPQVAVRFIEATCGWRDHASRVVTPAIMEVDFT